MKGINLICGKLSYAKLAQEYEKIFGVTGTYECLHQKSKEFLFKYFDIFITSPSIFLPSKTKSYFDMHNS